MLVLVNNSFFFEFIINALHECLNELNIIHEIIYEDNFNDTDIYLLCTCHEERKLPRRYIAYNYEQFTTDKIWHPKVFMNFKNAELVFDYSLENIKILKKYNINAHFLPLGYHKSMEYDNNNDNNDKTIDFFFTGSVNNYRHYKLLYPLKNIYYDYKDRFIIYSYNCWGNDLKKICSNTKIGLNIHYNSGNCILEIARIIILLANKVLVISEYSSDKWYDNKYKPIINFFENVNYSIDCINLLQKYNSQEVERRYQELITNYKYIDYVKEIIHLIKNL
jgi:hypothetical protein